MNAIDWFIIAVIVLSSVLGLVRGFLRETIALVAWLVGLWVAWKFSYVIEPYLGGMLAEPAARVWVARLIILFLVLLIGSVIAVFLHYFIHHTPFGTIDRSFGAVFGFLRGLVMIGLAVIVGQLLELDGEAWWRESKLMPAADFLASWVRHIVNDIAPAIERAF